MSEKFMVLTIQKWGNSLAVRIPSKLARNAHFHQGTQVELSVQKGIVLIKPTGERKLTLKERLELFDPETHGGEVMAIKPIGAEKL